MEFVKAMQTRNKMCKTVQKQNPSNYCSVCPLSSFNNSTKEPCAEIIYNNPELAESILEQWNKEHPVQTRADKLRELFPNLKLNTDGLPEMCPPELDCNLKCEVELSDCECSETICNKCHRDFWTAEYEPPEKNNRPALPTPDG